MKKLGLGILITVTVLVIAGITTAAITIPAAPQAKEKAEVAVEQSPAISGDWALTPPGLEKIEFIHWKKGYGKPPGKTPGAPSCYKFLTGSKIKWATTTNYVINPTKSDLPEDFVESAIFASAETWDATTSKELFNDNYSTSTGLETAYGNPNYVNAISFGDRYLNPDIIAATIVWYNPATKAIVEFDITFETNYNWGDCLGYEETYYSNQVMDLQNIATHELGHGVGLADIYDTTCSAVTMYGYSDYGETQKRTLEQPDITGLQKLYGI